MDAFLYENLKNCITKVHDNIKCCLVYVIAICSRCLYKKLVMNFVTAKCKFGIIRKKLSNVKLYDNNCYICQTYVKLCAPIM